MSFPQNITLVYYIDDAMMIGPSEQEIATTLDSLVTHIQIRGWEINPTKIQGLSTSVNFLVGQWCGGMQRYSFQGKEQVIVSGPSQYQEISTCFVVLFEFWRQHIPHLGMPLRTISHVTWKAADFG